MIKVKIKIDDEVIKEAKVFLAPNCKNDIGYCLIRPRQALWYIKAIFYDKIRLKFFNEKQ